MFEVNNRNVKHRNDVMVFVVKFKQISRLVLVFLLLTFEQVTTGWDKCFLSGHTPILIGLDILLFRAMFLLYLLNFSPRLNASLLTNLTCSNHEENLVH